MYRETLVLDFTTSHNYWTLSQLNPCNDTPIPLFHRLHIVLSHGWLADAQVSLGSSGTSHTPAGATANLIDLTLVRIDEGLNLISATKFLCSQVAM